MKKFEVHITLNKSNKEFSFICAHNDIKLIELALLDKIGKKVETQTMTSIVCDNPYHFYKQVRHFADNCGLKIQRIKVETSPINAIPALYYECHFHSPLTFNLPKSLRLDKKGDSISYLYRAKTLGQFNDGYQRLQLHRFTNRVEKAVFDTNVNLDKGWMDLYV